MCAHRKGHDSITVPNFSTLFFTSNNADSFKITANDRRFVLLNCSDRYVRNVEYMSNLVQEFAKPEVARAVYQLCMRRDLSKYYTDGFQAHRPTTRCVRARFLITCYT